MLTVTASVARLLIALAGGWLAIHAFGGGVSTVYAAMLASLVIFGATNALALASGVWRHGREFDSRGTLAGFPLPLPVQGEPSRVHPGGVSPSPAGDPIRKGG